MFEQVQTSFFYMSIFYLGVIDQYILKQDRECVIRKKRKPVEWRKQISFSYKMSIFSSFSYHIFTNKTIFLLVKKILKKTHDRNLHISICFWSLVKFIFSLTLIILYKVKNGLFNLKKVDKRIFNSFCTREEFYSFVWCALSMNHKLSLYLRE